ncbi:MAG: DUF4276 family protein [Acidobacteria bacterium]|nr:DUF4276 family protein [Acidobacteriota bacterium]
MEVRIACIIEGHGEREAVPIVVRRIAWRLDPALKVQVPACIRISRNKLVKAGELERAVELAARKAGSQGAVLVMLDSDDDCPAELGPELLRRATQARGNLPVAVVLPKREFESWFLAAAASLREHRGLAADIQPPSNPESIRGAKEWLSQRMGVDRQYIETLDQAPLAARFDLDLARRADSFDKCYRDIVRLLTDILARAPG